MILDIILMVGMIGSGGLILVDGIITVVNQITSS